MRKVNIREAKTHLSKLAEQAGAGEEIIIAKSGRPVARLVPLAHGPALRRNGLLKGKIKISDDFDQPHPTTWSICSKGRANRENHAGHPYLRMVAGQRS